MGLCGELWMVEKAIQKEGCIKVRWKMAVSQPSWKHNWVNWGDMGYVVFIVIYLFVIAIIHKVFCQLRMNHHTTLRLTKNLFVGQDFYYIFNILLLIRENYSIIFRGNHPWVWNIAIAFALMKVLWDLWPVATVSLAMCFLSSWPYQYAVMRIHKLRRQRSYRQMTLTLYFSQTYNILSLLVL